jgi:glutathione S-transferase
MPKRAVREHRVRRVASASIESREKGSAMKLYTTPGSAYARMARVVVHEKDLTRRVEVVVARTRLPDSPYYAINPSGRVPYLVRDDGIGMEESAVICAYLDAVDASPRLAIPLAADPWEARRLEALARSMLDGLAVWTREILRPKAEQSPAVIGHEGARSARLVDHWEQLAEHPLMTGSLQMLHITLACALGLEERIPEFRWRAGHPRLDRWYAAISARPSFVETRPPAAVQAAR